MLGIFNHIWDASMLLLPRKMNTAEAKAQVIAIGLQESRFTYRRQVTGPARGFYQFESGGGVAQVLTHHTTRDYTRDVLAALRYQPIIQDCYEGIEHNDILATAFARLLLWSLPDALPKQYKADDAWNVYIKAWKPGKPHRQTWDAFYDQAWSLV